MQSKISGYLELLEEDNNRSVVTRKFLKTKPFLQIE